MKKYFLFVLIFIFCIGCQQSEQKKVDENSSVNTTKQSLIKKSELSKNISTRELASSGDTSIFHLKMDTANRHVTVAVKILSGKELNVSLFSNDKKANIRISQIELPDSTFDGPFGKDVHYKIQAPGNYKIIIGEDMMAGNRWKGDFILKVFVK